MNQLKKILPWKVTSESVSESFPIFQFFRSTRLNPQTGQEITFYLMRGHDWVNVIPLTPDGQVVLVRQYRHGSESETIEIPGGCVEPGEDPALAAGRELAEESGYVARELELLGAIHPNPAFQSNRCFCYLAKGVTLQKHQELDQGEVINVETHPLEEVLAMIRRGEMTHAIMLATFSLYLLQR